jgi:hypothetical protein
MVKGDYGAVNARLRETLRELRATSALLRVKATNLALGNRRLLREIKRTLKKPR